MKFGRAHFANPRILYVKEDNKLRRYYGPEGAASKYINEVQGMDRIVEGSWVRRHGPCNHVNSMVYGMPCTTISTGLIPLCTLV